MSLGLFDFHDHLADNTFHINDQSEERFINLCFNRFKTCQIDPRSHRYVLDTRTENGKKEKKMIFIEK
jgi:hypothetical protein